MPLMPTLARRAARAVAVLALAALGARAADAQTAYAVNTARQLYRIDFAAQTKSLIGTINLSSRPVDALALSASGVLYATTYRAGGTAEEPTQIGELWTVNTSTAQATFVADLPERIGALDFRGSALYALSALRSTSNLVPSRLYEVNTATGAATVVIANTALILMHSSMSLDGDNTLYVIGHNSTSTPTSTQLSRLNLTPGAMPQTETIASTVSTAPSSNNVGGSRAGVTALDVLGDGELYGLSYSKAVRFRKGDGRVTELFEVGTDRLVPWTAMTNASTTASPPPAALPTRVLPDAVTLGACVSRPTTVSQVVMVLPGRDPYHRVGGHTPVTGVGLTLHDAAGGPAPSWVSASVVRERITIYANTTGLSQGTHRASAQVSASGYASTTFPIEVTVGTGPAIGVVPPYLEFGGGVLAWTGNQSAILANVGCGGPLTEVGISTKAGVGWYPTPEGRRAEPHVLAGTYNAEDGILTAQADNVPTPSGSETLQPVSGTSYDAFRVSAAGAVPVWLPALYRKSGDASIATTPPVVRFGAVTGSADPIGPQVVFLTNGSGGEALTSLGVSAPEYSPGQPTGWLTPSLYQSNWMLRLDANATGLPAGTYTALVRVTAAQTSTDQHTVLATLTVRDAPASATEFRIIRTSPGPLVVPVTPGGPTVSRTVNVAAAPTVAPGTPGSGGVTGIAQPAYGVGGGAYWLGVSAAAYDGGEISQLLIQIDASQLPAGLYAASVALTTPGAVNGPHYLTVIADATGTAVVDADAATMNVDGIAPEAAAADLLGGTPLPPAVRAALDAAGNRNGTFDLGDVLAHADRTDRPLDPATLARLLAAPKPPAAARRPQPRP